MKAVILIDNNTSSELKAEWGLAVYIESGEKRVLLDTGSTGDFCDNAKALGIDLSAVDAAVLSHAHYDHSDGMERFFGLNSKAKMYIRQGSGENCYARIGFFGKYIGIHKGWLKKYADRIEYAAGDVEILPGIWLIPHKTPGLAEYGKAAKMYVRDHGWKPDDFSHEQSLVVETENGLAVFNSCSHGGVDNIIREVQSTFPNKRIIAVVGGFHLFRTPGDRVHALAQSMKTTGVEKIFTGHCTGDKACEILSEEFGDKMTKLESGLVIEL